MISFIILWIHHPFAALFILLTSLWRWSWLITSLALFLLSSIFLLTLSRVLITLTSLVLFLLSIILVSNFSLNLHIILWILLFLEHEMFSFLTMVNFMITMVVSMAITVPEVSDIVFINVRGVSIVVALMVKVLVMMLNIVKHVG